MAVGRRVLGALRLQLAPVGDDIRAVAVDLEPGQRLIERLAMQQASLRAHRRLDVEHARDHREDLLKAFDVAARNRQQSQLEFPLHRVRVEARSRSDDPHRMQQRPGEDRVGERVGRRVELGAVSIDRTHRVPEGFGAVLEFRRDLAQQPGFVQLAERLGGMP